VDGHDDRWRRRAVTAAVAVPALVMLVAGAWCWLDPSGFAVATRWPPHDHFLRDAGAFQMGLGLIGLAALRWRDLVAVVLTAGAATNGLHAVNHIADSAGGGRAADPWFLGGLAALCAVGLVLRLRPSRRTDRDRVRARG
jgi:hypothetical protein